MAGKGSLWSAAEVQCLLEIWADESIQEQLDKTHKNSDIFRKIRDYLLRHGYQRTTEQCRDKVKKLRGQYLRVRDALRKSGSSAEEKDKFQWYDAIDSIIGSKPSSQPNVLESHPRRSLDSTSSDTENTGLERSQSLTSVNSIASNTGDETQDTSDNTETIPSEQGKKRKRKVEVSEMMTAFLDMQKRQNEEFIQGENLRYQQEKEMFDNWMKAQVQMEERRLQLQREERQETNMMFLQTMNRLFDAMIPSHSHHQPSPQHPSPHAPPPPTPPPPATHHPHLQYPYHAETSSSYSELDNSTHVYRNL
ncbi:uncharacterized protein [Misgurnus anguillicaudatus]|uniref:uncharacterized protein n=1 Tax=Misgurnus anguillicaudatus TaxID=75329 RepID=UPI003CCF3287